MINPWKRFTAWLHYLRHPCTIITMDEAPANGVKVNFTYGGEYGDVLDFLPKVNALLEALIECGEHNRKLQEVQKPLDHTVEFWAPIEGKMPDPNILADMLSEGKTDKSKDWPWDSPFEDGNDVPQEPKYGTIDYVDHCMNNLGMSLNFADPDGTLSSKGYKNDNEKQIWQSVLLDYRTLSDAIAALKKGQ